MLQRMKMYVPPFIAGFAVCACLVAALAAEKATPQSLGGDKRYITYLSTDKPIYRPGETLRLRGVVLNAAAHQPLPGRRRRWSRSKAPRATPWRRP